MDPAPLLAEKYRLEFKVGEGGTGVVYRARDVALGRNVAVKILHPELAADPRARQRFVREARVAGQLVHPGAVCVLDWGVDDGQLFLVMEWLDGRPLRASLPPAGELAAAHALSIVGQVASVLVAAHAIGLVHRDLKPENILVTSAEPPIARVVDFGLARILGEPASQHGLGQVTDAGGAIVSVAYAAPEVIAGGEPTAAADIYSLGCVLHECVVGELPFLGTAAELRNAHLYLPLPPPRRRNPQLTAALEELLIEMLDKQPERRPDAAAVLARLPAAGVVEELRPRGDRAARGLPNTTPPAMPAAEATRPAMPAAAAQAPVVAGVGLPAPLAAELVSAGFALAAPDDPRVTIALVIGGSRELVRELVARGLAVICDADVLEVEQVAELLRLGVREVVSRPPDGDDVIRKLRRLMRRRPSTLGPR
jgi:eukaryotic-like serine/threonine-protein kinase